MRYVEITQPGGPDVLAIAQMPVPQPRRGEVSIAVEAAGISRADVWQRRGLYPPLGTRRQRDERLTALGWLLNLADGRHDLVAIAERSGAEFDLLDELAKRETIVVLDSPSLRPATDAAVLSNFADVTLLIVRPGKTRRDSLEASAEALRQAGGRLLGVVLNRVPRHQQ